MIGSMNVLIAKGHFKIPSEPIVSPVPFVYLLIIALCFKIDFCLSEGVLALIQ